MTIDIIRINARSDAGIFMGVSILAPALGIVVWKTADLPWYSIFLVSMIVIGAYLLIRSVFTNKAARMSPVKGEFEMVWGYLLLVAGAVGMTAILAGLEGWILLVILLVLVAILIIAKSMKGRM